MNSPITICIICIIMIQVKLGSLMMLKRSFSWMMNLRVKDLNEFIFEKYELFDEESQNKRLKWLTSDGLVTRHEVNPQILKVQK